MPATESLMLKTAWGTAAADMFDTGVPVIAGEPVERLFTGVRSAGKLGRQSLFEKDGWLFGAATVPITMGLEAATRQVYEDIFSASRNRQLARIWNYVPAINATSPDGLENYHKFCRGRSLAFEQQHGAGYKAVIPSASAVGCQTSSLTVAFAACSASPRHVENPLQVPAYDYPLDYGPRPPSFARATVVPGRGKGWVFISGTSAIRGHQTIAPHHTRDQLTCTLENLREISLACGLGPHLDAGGSSARYFKIYLRHATDHPTVAPQIEECLLQPGDTFSYVQADICRAPLNVEIEASLRPH